MSFIKEEVNLDFTEEIKDNYMNSFLTSLSKEANLGESLVNHNPRKLPSWMNSNKKENLVRSIKQESKDNNNTPSITISSSAEFIKKEFGEGDESSPNITILPDFKCVKQEPNLCEDISCQFSIETKNKENKRKLLSGSAESNKNAEINTTNVDTTVTGLKISNEVPSGNDHISSLSSVFPFENIVPLNFSKTSHSSNPPSTQKNSSSINITLPPSNTSAQLHSTSNADDNALSAGSSGKRTNCRYGSSCYRSNVHHKQHFSHPGDCDYDGDNKCDSTSDRRNSSRKPGCWYGKKCFRKNEEHLQKFNHPSTSSSPSKRKRNPTTVVNCHIQSSNGSFTSINSDEYDDSFIDDNSSDDFHLTDSADEEEFSDFDSSSSESENERRSKGRTNKKRKTFSLF